MVKLEEARESSIDVENRGTRWCKEGLGTMAARHETCMRVDFKSTTSPSNIVRIEPSAAHRSRKTHQESDPYDTPIPKPP